MGSPGLHEVIGGTRMRPVTTGVRVRAAGWEGARYSRDTGRIVYRPGTVGTCPCRQPSPSADSAVSRYCAGTRRAFPTRRSSTAKNLGTRGFRTSPLADTSRQTRTTSNSAGRFGFGYRHGCTGRGVNDDPSAERGFKACCDLPQIPWLRAGNSAVMVVLVHRHRDSGPGLDHA